MLGELRVGRGQPSGEVGARQLTRRPLRPELLDLTEPAAEKT